MALTIRGCQGTNAVRIIKNESLQVSVRQIFIASWSLTKDIPKSFQSYCTPKLFRQTSVIEFQENLTPAPRSEVFGIVFVRPRIKDKLTLLDGVNKVEILVSVSSSSTPLSIDQLSNEHTESEQI